MDYTPHDFGAAAWLEADAVGEPGHRTFRLLVASGEGTASLWLEKEELQALGVAIDQLMARLSGRVQWKYYGAASSPAEPVRSVVGSPTVEFKIGQLSLGYEGDTNTFVLLVHAVEADPEGPATFTCLATPTQMRTLVRRIETVLSAGRPRCPLCGDPMGPEAHICVRAN